MTGVILAGELDDIGNHLLDMGNGWAEKSLALGLLIIVLVTIAKKMSVKAAIGTLIGLVIAGAIYDSRNDMSDAVKDEVTDINGAPAVHAPLIPGLGTATQFSAQGGERA